MYHRDLVTVIREMLTIVKSGASKNQLIYKANLGFRQAERYLSFLLEKGHLKLRIHHNRREYLLTTNGEKLLNLLTTVQTELEGVLPRDIESNAADNRVTVHRLAFGSNEETGKSSEAEWQYS